MFYIPKNKYYFSEYFKSTSKKLHSKLKEEHSFRKVAKLLYMFLKTPDKVANHAKTMQSHSPDNCVRHYSIEILNLFDPDFQLINTN